MSIWLYHINPKRNEYTYSWDVEQPRTILRNSDKEWLAGQMFRLIEVDDTLCVYMKNIQPRKEGVYVIGTVTGVDVNERTFRWRVDKRRSARRLGDPIPKQLIHTFFGRSYGNSMQRLAPSKEKRWLGLFQTDEVVDDVPLLKARGVPRALSPSATHLPAARMGYVASYTFLRFCRNVTQRCKVTRYTISRRKMPARITISP